MRKLGCGVNEYISKKVSAIGNCNSNLDVLVRYHGTLSNFPLYGV